MAEKLILKVRPSWWNYAIYLLFFWLVIPLVIALWKRYSVCLKVYEDRVVVERGILSKEIKDLFIEDIRSVDVYQNILQRIVNIGEVKIATAATSGYEEIVRGLPDPRGIREKIISLRQGF